MDAHYFLGLQLAENLRAPAEATADDFCKTVQYKQRTFPEDFHVTLFFFGALKEQQIPLLKRTVAQTISGSVPLTLNFSGVDGFGERRHPRVLYASLTPCEALGRMRDSLGKALSAAGFAIDTRPYHPHLTLAKRWIRGDMGDRLPASDCPMSGQSWPVHTLTLFRVCPGRRPRYLPVQEFCLGPK